MSADAAASRHGDAAVRAPDERQHEIKLVRTMRADLPATGHDTP